MSPDHSVDWVTMIMFGFLSDCESNRQRDGVSKEIRDVKNEGLIRILVDEAELRQG